MTVTSGGNDGDGDRGRRLLLGLQLLDRQIVDREGRLAGKVDDVELTTPEEGGPPIVTALVSGRGALARRLGGRMGRAAAALSRRLDPQQGEPGRIPLGDVSDIGNHVTVARDADELTVYTAERAVRDGIIGRIPGASDRDVAE
jgi:sporulation protein YlmC with PRC-barrel domain